MEKLKQFQPIVIVVLIGIVLYQFTLIEQLRQEIYSVQSNVSDLQEKITDRYGIESKLSTLESRMADVENDIENFDKRLKTTDIDVSGMQITVMKHDDFIRDLEQERLFSNRVGW